MQIRPTDSSESEGNPPPLPSLFAVHAPAPASSHNKKAKVQLAPVEMPADESALTEMLCHGVPERMLACARAREGEDSTGRPHPPPAVGDDSDDDDSGGDVSSCSESDVHATGEVARAANSGLHSGSEKKKSRSKKALIEELS